MEKVVVIGVDGASPDLMELWMNKGKLPHFQKIREKGVWGKLASTIPPFSAPAWTSIITGCNLGKHGIYGFERTDTLETNLITSRYRKTSAIWNYLTDIGLKSIIVNVPGTYPPEKINGVMITGLLTPSPESNFTYPWHIKERLMKDDLGEYELESIWLEDFPRSFMAKHVPDKLLNLLLKQMESRAQVTLNLMKNLDWDFTMVVFRGTDTVQHFLFDKKDMLLSCYQKVDELVGKIMEIAPKATFFIVSDHGFEEIKKILHPDNVLYNAGLLKPYQEPYGSAFSIIWYSFFKMGRFFLRILPPDTIKHSTIIKKLLFSSASKHRVYDFSKTKAFCTAEGRGIQINLKGRYRGGIIENKDYEKTRNEIIKLFSEFKDQENNKRFIEEVYRGNEIYGEEAWNPLDLILSPKKGYSTSEGLRSYDSLSNRLQSKGDKLPILFKHDAAERTGDHAPYGIFFAYGKDVKPGHTVHNISVMDVLPLVFTAMNIPVPNSIDGKVYAEIFREKPKVKTVDWKSFTSSKQMLKKSEIERIRELKEKIKQKNK